MPAKNATGEKSKIRTLLELLKTEGKLDATELQERTGFSKPLIAATMCCARDRGMVSITAREDGEEGAGQEATCERRTESRRTKRGQVYTFVSYTSVVKPDREFEFVDPWPEDLRHALEKALMPGVRGLIAALDQTSTQRRVQTLK